MGKRGLKIRPCHVCSEPVNFVAWQDESLRRARRIFHWANPDGSHHIHGNSEELRQQQHLREVLADSN